MTTHGDPRAVLRAAPRGDLRHHHKGWGDGDCCEVPAPKTTNTGVVTGSLLLLDGHGLALTCDDSGDVLGGEAVQVDVLVDLLRLWRGQLLTRCAAVEFGLPVGEPCLVLSCRFVAAVDQRHHRGGDRDQDDADREADQDGTPVGDDDGGGAAAVRSELVYGIGSDMVPSFQAGWMPMPRRAR